MVATVAFDAVRVEFDPSMISITGPLGRLEAGGRQNLFLAPLPPIDQPTDQPTYLLTHQSTTLAS